MAPLIMKASKQTKCAKELETELNSLLRKFGYSGYQVVIMDDVSREIYGEIDTKNKVIYIYTSDPEEAYKTLYHELLELELRPLLNKYRSLINLLITYINQELEREKDKTIERIINWLIDNSDNKPIPI